MAYVLAKLLEGTGARVLFTLEVAGISSDSRNVKPGEAFFALRGTRSDGNAFIAGAIERGAKVIVTETRPVDDQPVPIIVVNDARAAYAVACAHLFAPQPETSVAVTGTNGKTSVASFVRQIWQAHGLSAASVGTLGIETSGGLAVGTMTTPDPMMLHRALGKLREGGVDHVAMEASSHGLDQRRLDGVHFAAVAFTNLTRDHLDYHGDIAAYRNAKLRLFSELLIENGAAVVNVDDPEHLPFMHAALDRGAALMTVGEAGAWFEISKIENVGFGQRVTGRLVGEPAAFVLPLTGRFQAENALVALALASATGVPVNEGMLALAKLQGARGRLELVGSRDDSAVFVDYAHTPDALRNALEALRPYARGKLSVVFGCGGDRDKGKRPLMGAIARELADCVVVTDDNPRTEDAATIRAEILAAAGDVTEIADRRRAIEAAIHAMGPGDVVLVAGKGHEDYQIVGTTKSHFSDHEVVANALKALA